MMRSRKRGIDTKTQRAPIDEDISAAALPEGLETPCLVADLGRVKSNIEKMARLVGDRGVALRPHFKTHKSVEVAHLQRAAGAQGFTCATIGEAEVLAGGGLTDIFIAYPLWPSQAKAARLDALKQKVHLAVGVESEEGALHLGRLCSPGLEVLVEIDPGDGRTGTSPENAGSVADSAKAAGLSVAGVFCHGGHSYGGPDAAEGAADDEVDTLTRASASLHAHGHEPRVVSAGSTPTALLSARSGVTEERPGTYVFQDRQQIHMGAGDPDDAALVVAATVISASPGRIVLDSGAKSLAKDLLGWMRGYGTIAGYSKCEIVRLYDHHAVAEVDPSAASPTLGEVVAVVPNHVCPVVNLFDVMIVTEGGEEVGSWPVHARGRNS